MKQIYLTLLLLCMAAALGAKNSDLLIRARIISEEEMTITGSFTFNLEVVALDTCQLDSIRILNNGGF